MKTRGFTLIELLIVVAIIGILAAIAVPNFLNAQIRAKIARSQSDIRMLKDVVQMRNLDTNLWLIDGNDSGGGENCSFEGTFFGKKPIDAGIRVLQGDNHFNGQVYLPLTTPVNYIGSIPTDPFANGLYYSYEDWGCSNTPNGVFGLLAAAGPDADSGDWHPDQLSIAYDSSNGVASNGDLWYVWKFRKSTNSQGEKYYDQYFRDNPWGF